MKHTRSILPAILAIALLVFSLAGCGANSSSVVPGSNSSDASASASVPASEDNAQPQEPYAFAYNGNSIAMGANINDVVSTIGEPQSIFESPSCAFEGVDKIYYYPGFEIYTYPQNEEDLISSLSLVDDSVQTQEGAYLGMSAEEVESLYGTNASGQENMLSYIQADTELAFVLEDDVVVDITYYYVPAQQIIQEAA